MANLPRLTDASLAEIEERSQMADKIALPWIVKAKGYTLTHQEVITLCLAACDVPALLAEVRALHQDRQEARHELMSLVDRIGFPPRSPGALDQALAKLREWSEHD